MRAVIIHVSGGDQRRARNLEPLAASVRAAGVERVEVVEGVQPPDAGPLRSRGEWGCYLSHLEVLERVVEDGGPALVLEDDAVLRVHPDRLRALLDVPEPWDLLHPGYLLNTVFRDWDEELARQPVLRVRGVMYGTQCYAVRPEGLAPRLEVLRALPFEAPASGGGVGYDGALCELAWRDAALVRLAPPRSLFVELPGLSSGIRPRGRVQRVRERAGWQARLVVGRARSALRRDAAVQESR